MLVKASKVKAFPLLLFARPIALALATVLPLAFHMPAAKAQALEILNGLRILTNTFNSTRSQQKLLNSNVEESREQANDARERQQKRAEAYRSWYGELSQESKEVASWLVFKASLGDFPGLNVIASSEWFQRKSLQQKQYIIVLYRETASHIQSSDNDANEFFKNAYCVHASGSICPLEASLASSQMSPLAMKSPNPPWEQPQALIKQKTNSNKPISAAPKQASGAQSDGPVVHLKGVDIEQLRRSAEVYKRSNGWDGRIRSYAPGASQTGINCAHYRAQMSAYQAQQRYAGSMAGELGAMTGGYWSARGSVPVMPVGCR